MPTTKDYLSCADTAKLVRAALKRHFPAIKFSVTSKTYSGGASIDVHWTDGPRPRIVEGVAGRFAGADFDGMIDLKTHHSTVVVGADGPREIQYGADFVFCSRTDTDFDRKVAEAEALIGARCALDETGKRFGSNWVADLARGIVFDTDHMEENAVERAFRRVVLREGAEAPSHG